MMDLIRNAGRTLYKWWMAFARLLGTVNAAVLLTVVYIAVIGPMALIARLLRKDPMKHRPDPSDSFWMDKEEVAHTVDQARHVERETKMKISVWPAA